MHRRASGTSKISVFTGSLAKIWGFFDFLIVFLHVILTYFLQILKLLKNFFLHIFRDIFNFLKHFYIF